MMREFMRAKGLGQVWGTTLQRVCLPVVLGLQHECLFNATALAIVVEAPGSGAASWCGYPSG